MDLTENKIICMKLVTKIQTFSQFVFNKKTIVTVLSVFGCCDYKLLLQG